MALVGDKETITVDPLDDKRAHEQVSTGGELAVRCAVAV